MGFRNKYKNTLYHALQRIQEIHRHRFGVSHRDNKTLDLAQSPDFGGAIAPLQGKAFESDLR